MSGTNGVGGMPTGNQGNIGGANPEAGTADITPPGGDFDAAEMARLAEHGSDAEISAFLSSAREEAGAGGAAEESAGAGSADTSAAQTAPPDSTPPSQGAATPAVAQDQPRPPQPDPFQVAVVNALDKMTARLDAMSRQPETPATPEPFRPELSLQRAQEMGVPPEMLEGWRNAPMRIQQLEALRGREGIDQEKIERGIQYEKDRLTSMSLVQPLMTKLAQVEKQLAELKSGQQTAADLGELDLVLQQTWQQPNAQLAANWSTALGLDLDLVAPIVRTRTGDRIAAEGGKPLDVATEVIYELEGAIRNADQILKALPADQRLATAKSLADFHAPRDLHFAALLAAMARRADPGAAAKPQAGSPPPAGQPPPAGKPASGGSPPPAAGGSTLSGTPPDDSLNSLAEHGSEVDIWKYLRTPGG